jgi:hypothetical protein
MLASPGGNAPDRATAGNHPDNPGPTAANPAPCPVRGRRLRVRVLRPPAAFVQTVGGSPRRTRLRQATHGAVIPTSARAPRARAQADRGRNGQRPKQGDPAGQVMHRRRGRVHREFRREPAVARLRAEPAHDGRARGPARDHRRPVARPARHEPARDDGHPAGHGKRAVDEPGTVARVRTTPMGGFRADLRPAGLCHRLARRVATQAVASEDRPSGRLPAKVRLVEHDDRQEQPRTREGHEAAGPGRVAAEIRHEGDEGRRVRRDRERGPGRQVGMAPIDLGPTRPRVPGRLPPPQVEAGRCPVRPALARRRRCTNRRMDRRLPSSAGHAWKENTADRMILRSVPERAGANRSAMVRPSSAGGAPPVRHRVPPPAQVRSPARGRRPAWPEACCAGPRPRRQPALRAPAPWPGGSIPRGWHSNSAS